MIDVLMMMDGEMSLLFVYHEALRERTRKSQHGMDFRREYAYLVSQIPGRALQPAENPGRAFAGGLISLLYILWTGT